MKEIVELDADADVDIEATVNLQNITELETNV